MNYVTNVILYVNMQAAMNNPPEPMNTTLAPNATTPAPPQYPPRWMVQWNELQSNIDVRAGWVAVERVGLGVNGVNDSFWPKSAVKERRKVLHGKTSRIKYFHKKRFESDSFPEHTGSVLARP